ncbi:hypothetical protein [Rubrivirga sp.]|uniref:hypothetical protein n=1 Tax=Rubrivirga sp. TaxID=1885344 RepID=UPI003C70F326
MGRDDRDGLLLSVTIHVVVLFLLAVAVRLPPDALDEDYPPQLMAIEFGPAPTRPVITGPPERAEAGQAADSRQQLETERPTPPAPTTARIPDRPQTPPRTADPLPRPVQSNDARPSRVNPPSRATTPERDPTPPQQTEPREGGGSSQGAGNRDGEGDGPGSGSGGDAPVEVGFQFGNRTFDCPSAPFAGVEGQVDHRVTFDPRGRYVADRPVTRNGVLNDAVRRVISRCRAQPLPPQARQVNQTTVASFRFTAN